VIHREPVLIVVALSLCTLTSATLAAPVAVRSATAAVSSANPLHHSIAGPFPTSIYPRPVKFPAWGLGEGCPSRAGIQVPGVGAQNAAFQVLALYGRVSLRTDFYVSDRVLWPHHRRAWVHGPPAGCAPLLLANVLHAGCGSRSSPYGGLIQRNCGGAILARSLWFAICQGRCYPATTTYLNVAATGSSGFNTLKYCARCVIPELPGELTQCVMGTLSTEGREMRRS
jgi:hypothetical protein